MFEPKKYEDFLKSNKNKYASASKDCFNEELVIEYFLQDHRPLKKWNKIKNYKVQKNNYLFMT